MSLRIPRFSIQVPTDTYRKYQARVEITSPIATADPEEIYGWQTDQEHPDLDQVRVIGRTKSGEVWLKPSGVWLELARFATAPGFLSREEGGATNLQIHTPGRIKEIKAKDHSRQAA